MYRCTFVDDSEAAAFVAALSRFLAGPDGARFRTPGAEPLVWTSPSERAADARYLYLSDAAYRATSVRFAAPDAARVEPSRVPPDCTLLYGAGEIHPWGIDEARRRLG